MKFARHLASVSFGFNLETLEVLKAWKKGALSSPPPLSARGLLRSANFWLFGDGGRDGWPIF